MATLRGSSPTSAVSRDLNFDLRNQNAAASAGVHQNAKWAKNLLGDLDGESRHGSTSDSTSTDGKVQATLFRHGAHLLTQHNTALDPAFSWSPGRTYFKQVPGEMHPYDLRNAILSSANKHQAFPTSSAEMDLLIDASRRSSEGTESWTVSRDYGKPQSRTNGSESTYSVELDVQDGRCRDDLNSSNKTLLGSHKTFPFLEPRQEPARVKGNFPHYLLAANEGPVHPPPAIPASTRVEALVGREWTTQSSKLASVLSQGQSSGPSLQSSNILTFHANMTKLSLPLSPKLQEEGAENRESERQDDTSLDRSMRTDDELSKESKLRNPLTSSDGDDATTSELSKRPKLSELSPATTLLPPKSPQTQVRKEKLGDRITALQQLVSPFGKTDTASVLLEAIGYIKFLQDQVQVLSSPYMKPMIGRQGPGKDSGEVGSDLRSRGLCLVPVSCTLHVANSNGADYWTSGIGGGGSRY